MAWYKYVTTEPTMFFYMMAYMITNVIEQTFYVFRACTVNHGYSKEICYNISSYPQINTEVQVTSSIFLQWFQIANHLVPLVLAFFLGSWSDKRGRKCLLLGGLIGKLYFSVAVTIITMYDWPIEYVIYFAAFPSTLLGSDLAIFAGCFAYIADVTSVSNRTLRIGILDAVYLSTMPSGVALGNYLYYNVFNKSFTAMFLLNSTLMFISTLYTLVFLKWQTLPNQKSMKQAGVKNPIKDFFDLDNIRKTLYALSKKRINNGRMYLWFLFISMALYTFQRDERAVLYLYTTVVFQWDTADFSYYRTYLSTMYVIIILFGIPVMTKVFRWRDTLIVMLGALSHISGHLLYAQARAPSYMYIGATAAAFGPCVAPLIRSMTSKLLEPNERGVAYAFLSMMENAVGMFSSIIYSQLYIATLDTDYISSFLYLTISTQAIVFLFALTMDLVLKGKDLVSITEEDKYSTSSN